MVAEFNWLPDYAELLIDALNVQSGLPPAEASDIFGANPPFGIAPPLPSKL